MPFCAFQVAQKEKRKSIADYKSAGSKRSREGQIQDRKSRAAEFATETWCVYARLHADAEKAKFGIAEGGPGKTDQRY